MSTAHVSAAELLTELVRRGIELRADGGMLRYRPHSAMTPALAEHVQARRAELLELLGGDRIAEPPPRGQIPATTAAPAWGGRVDRPIEPEPLETRDAPHELSLEERIEAGFVNRGWTARAWADRLDQLAGRCRTLHPDLAAQYLAWAANVRKHAPIDN